MMQAALWGSLLEEYRDKLQDMKDLREQEKRLERERGAQVLPRVSRCLIVSLPPLPARLAWLACETIDRGQWAASTCLCWHTGSHC